MPMLDPSVAIVMSAAPNNAAFPAKQRPEATAIRGTTPDNAAQDANVVSCKPPTTG